MQLNVKACAIAGAILWGAGLFLLTWWLIFMGQANTETVALISQVYIGYDVSVAGSFIGLLWGAVDGLFGGFLFAWLYNRLSQRLTSREEAPHVAG